MMHVSKTRACVLPKNSHLCSIEHGEAFWRTRVFCTTTAAADSKMIKTGFYEFMSAPKNMNKTFAAQAIIILESVHMLKTKKKWTHNTLKKVRSIFLMARSKVFYAFSVWWISMFFPLRAVKRMNCFVTFCVMFRFAFHFINWPFRSLPVVQLFFLGVQCALLSQTEKFDLDNTLHLLHCQ